MYRGASLVDTVSTDSTGAYEKTVTGLSAGSLFILRLFMMVMILIKVVQ